MLLGDYMQRWLRDGTDLTTDGIALAVLRSGVGIVRRAFTCFPPCVLTILFGMCLPTVLNCVSRASV